MWRLQKLFSQILVESIIMAHVELKYCDSCNEVTNFVNYRCSKCSEREYRQKIAAWQALTTEEKLLDLMKRIERLENRRDPSY